MFCHFSPPPNVVLRPLSPDDVVIAESVWPNRHCGSLFFLKRLAQWNTSVGAFDHATGQLMAWTFHQQPGTMGALQVMTGFERRGLGSLVTRALSKKLAGIGRDTLALVFVDNKASIGMFEKLGFRRIDFAFLSWVLPPGGNNEDWID
jgi:ribosomal protein S18 acetylase RimI-like enzyme